MTRLTAMAFLAAFRNLSPLGELTSFWLTTSGILTLEKLDRAEDAFIKLDLALDGMFTNSSTTLDLALGDFTTLDRAEHDFAKLDRTLDEILLLLSKKTKNKIIIDLYFYLFEILH